jgi:hypothetical protein
MAENVKSHTCSSKTRYKKSYMINDPRLNTKSHLVQKLGSVRHSDASVLSFSAM